MESRTEKLGDIADITTGKTPSKRIENAYGNVIKFLTPRDFSGRFSVTTERMLSDQGYQAVYNQIVSGPSVSVTCIGSDMGKVIYNRESVVTNQQVNTLSNFKSNVDPLFLYYLLSTKKQELLSYGAGNGSTMPIITKSMFSKLEIKLPSVKVQRKLVACLSLLDDKIELNQQINKNLLKLSVLGFNKWLDSTQSNQYTSLDKIASFKNGIAMQKFSPTDKIHVLPVIKIRELNQGYIDSNSDSVTSVIDDDVKVHNGDLVFSWSGTLSAKIWTDGDAALNQHLFKVTSNRWPKWFYYLWVLHHLNTFRGIAADKKTTMGHIKRKDLTNAKVLIPNAKEFKNLDTILNPIIEQMVNGGIESKNLIDIRNILLPKLLSGSMDLSSIEETINND